MTNKWQRQRAALPSWTVGRSTGSFYRTCSGKSVDAWVLEVDLKKLSTDIRLTGTSSCPSAYPRSKGESPQLPVQLLLSAVLSNQCLQTSQFHLKSLPNSITVLSSGSNSGSSATSRAICFVYWVRRTRDRFQAVMLGIYSVAADISVCTGVDSASRIGYQDIPGGKGGRCVRVTT